MIEPFKSKNIKILTQDEIIDDKEDKVKYHYTSTSGLLSIIKGQTLRFTDARFMNDKSELSYFIDSLAFFLKKNKGYPECTKAFEKLVLNGQSIKDYKKIDVSALRFYTDIDVFKNQNLRQFVFCLSESSDSLNMWNYYSHSSNYQGYNIGINIEEFLKTFESRCSLKIDPFFIYCGKVLYAPNSQKQEIQHFCNDLESQDLPLNSKILHLWDYISTYGLFYKNNAFKHEDEYRVVIVVSEDILHSSIKEQKKEDKFIINISDGELNFATNIEPRNRDESFVKVSEGQLNAMIKTQEKNDGSSDFRFDFYERNGVVVPCLSVRFDKNSIKSIMIAPTIDEKLASSSLEEFLKINGYEAKVSNSKIPIRF